MLDGARDADRNVQFGRNNLSGLTDLHFVRHVTGINCRPRCADTGAERIRQLENNVEILRATERAAAGNHFRGGLQIGPIGFT